MTITLVDAKQFFIERLKATAALTSLVGADIREYEWQGTAFKFPNVRVQVESFERTTPGAECKIFSVVAHILVFAEDATSLQADQIAAIIWDALDTKSIGNTKIKFMNIKATHLGAVRQIEGGVWQSEVLIKSQASPA